MNEARRKGIENANSRLHRVVNCKVRWKAQRVEEWKVQVSRRFQLNCEDIERMKLFVTFMPVKVYKIEELRVSLY